MKLLAGGALVALTGGLFYLLVDQRPADVYPMSVDQAYGALAGIPYEQATGGMYSAAKKTSVSANGSNKVVWKNGAKKCDIILTPWVEDPEMTHVEVDCGGSKITYGPSQLAHNLYRGAIIEGVDALLTGREFDRQAANGATASRWPGDGAVGGYNKAVGDALKASDDMAKMKKEVEQTQPSSSFDYSDGDYGGGGWGE